MNEGIKLVGVVLCILGGIGMLDALALLHIHHPIVGWMDRWGDDAGWVVRGGVLLLGLSLVFMPPRGDR